MSRRGRHPVLNQVKQAEILAVLATGCNRQSAAHYVGCDPKTIYNTALRDPEFERKLHSRESAAEVAHLANLNKAGKDTRFWRASAWFLEHLYPDRYSGNAETITPEQLSLFTSRLMEMLVEEVPVARYRKNVLARLDKMINDSPENLERQYQRRKKLAAKNRYFPEDMPSRALPAPEKPQNHREKPEGTIPCDPKNA
jgi:hypothetical protein